MPGAWDTEVLSVEGRLTGGGQSWARPVVTRAVMRATRKTPPWTAWIRNEGTRAGVSGFRGPGRRGAVLDLFCFPAVVPGIWRLLVERVRARGSSG
ncbi:hypothetical protein SZN_23816 [Streptomyces zinciresistens K42]|uniref:Uncharacterized protein n=1 Tax=Streptomyces zinciresistens K42 TaxID=700597 RepID=G2GGX9_9ACTN|nr:hypothetical protein SZN_23816 [Streptomyces zinciresistens K42]